MSAEKTDEKTKGFTVQDRRWWLDENAGLDDLPKESDVKRPTYVEELETRLRANEQTLREYINAHKSSVADMDEVRQRLEKEVDRRVQMRSAGMAEPFLEVMDNLNRLQQAFQQGAAARETTEGMELIIRQVGDSLKKIGLEKITTGDCRFDPKSMEAVMTTEVAEQQVDMVLEEIQSGYRLGEQVVRPARVRVGVAKRG